MKHLLILTLLILPLLACSEGMNLITQDVISDAASCYESVEITEDTYLIALDKNCVDLELSSIGAVAPVGTQTQNTTVRDWTLLTTLERDVRQKLWHVFHVPKGTDQPILRAYIDGKDFLFTIENTRATAPSLLPIQYYFHQPEPPEQTTWLYYPSTARFYEHWGGKTTVLGFPIDRSDSGFLVDFDIGFAGAAFQQAENRAKDWVGGTVEFRTTRDGTFASETYAPHIKEGYVLKIYVR